MLLVARIWLAASQQPVLKPFADTYYSSNFNIKSVVRQILLSDAFYSDLSFQQHIKKIDADLPGDVEKFDLATIMSWFGSLVWLSVTDWTRGEEDKFDEDEFLRKLDPNTPLWGFIPKSTFPIFTAVHAQVCDDIKAFAASLGCEEIEVFASPITGGDGNAEFFLGARRG